MTRTTQKRFYDHLTFQHIYHHAASSPLAAKQNKTLEFLSLTRVSASQFQTLRPPLPQPDSGTSAGNGIFSLQLK